MFDKPDWISLFFKIFIPASIGISIKLAVQSKKEKMTPLKVILSYITGIGGAYLAYHVIKNNVDENLMPLTIAIVSISTEKIAEYLIYKWNIDYFLTSIIEAIRQFIIKLISK